MVVLRLTRHGAKKRPFYHIIATDKRSARDGRYIERLGYFNPIAKGAEVRLSIDNERVTHWQSLGAQPSPKVKSLLKEFDLEKALAKKQEQKEKKKALKAKSEEKTEDKAPKATKEEATPEVKEESSSKKGE